MTKGRMEAFSDAVIAIIMTVMVLQLSAPRGPEPSALAARIPAFLCYLLSFVFLGIYWNNHHHLLQAARGVDGRVLWANLHLLFWLSLIPFVTAWMGENRFAPWPVALYGVVMLLAGIAYYLLARALISLHGADSLLARALGEDLKGRISVAIYALAVPLAFISAWVSCALYVVVAIMWLVPDRRIARNLESGPAGR